MADGVRLDPFRSFKFRVTFGNYGVVAFRKVSGLNSASDKAEYREGTDINTVRKLPGLATFDDVTFEKGVGDVASLVDWRKQIVDLGNEANLPADNEFRTSVTITLLSHRGEEVRNYVLREAWPLSLSLGDMDAQSSDVIVEYLVLAHEGLRIETLIAATQ